MTRAALLGRYRALHKQQIETEAEMKSVERQILAPENAPPKSELKAKPGAKPKPKKTARTITTVTTAATREMARATLTALREVGAGQPVLRRDLAQHLGLSDYATTHRLKRLRAMGFVERVGLERYRVVDIVPDLADGSQVTSAMAANGTNAIENADVPNVAVVRPHPAPEHNVDQILAAIRVSSVLDYGALALQVYGENTTATRKRLRSSIDYLRRGKRIVNGGSRNRWEITR